MSNNSEIVTTPSRQVLINEQSLRDTAYAIRERENRPVKLKPSLFSKEIFNQIYSVIDGDKAGEIDLSVEENDVNFYDYDGTRVYSYSKEEFLSLSSLPDNPSHDNLVAQGWNWSLSDAKEYVLNYGILDIGQMYDSPQDEEHSNYIEITIELKENYLNPMVTVTATDHSMINWGDSTSWSEQRDQGNYHTYSKPGKYKIKIWDHNSDYTGYALFTITGTSSGSNLFTGGGTNDDIYRNCITDVKLGCCVKTLGNYAFKNCHSLRTISLHKDLNFDNANNCFLNCYSLKTIVLPYLASTIKYIPLSFCINCYSLQRIILTSNSIINNSTVSSQFYNCYSLKNIIIPNNNYGYLSNEMLSNCYSLSSIIIPKELNSSSMGVVTALFSNCYSLRKINMYPTTPFTVTNTTFTNLPTYTKIYVPWSRDHSILLTYKTATYWLDIADQIYLMPMNENILIYEAYAEFDSSDGSLTFFRDLPNKYTNNEVLGTKTYYTGIETTNYTSTPDIPWYSNKTSVTSVIFENKIIPISTAYWFYGMNNTNFTSIIGLEKLDTSDVTTMSYMFYNCSNLTSLDISHFDTNNVTNMSNMFYYCQNLTSLDVSHFDTSKVTNMTRMFKNCQSLTSLDVSHFDTSNITSMYLIFYNCQSLTSLDVSHFDTSNVTSMYSTFYNCQNLTSLDVSHFDTNNVNTMYDMFYNCQSLTSLDVSHFDTNNVTNMYLMFYYCRDLTSLDVSHFDTSKVTDMTRMFNNCKNLTTTLNIMKMPTNYGVMCYLAATASGSLITLKYISPVTSADIDTLVATKSSSSNVINGGQGTFVSPTPPTPPTPVGGAA